MRVLAVASQKGGSGKTMLACHLAVQAEASGAGKVVLVDSDPHGTLATWWTIRNDESPAFAQTSGERLAADLALLRLRGFRLAVVDTPPLATSDVAGVLALAELVVVPTRPYGDELRAAAGTVDLCARAGKPLLFVVNGAETEAGVAPASMMRLAQHGPVAPHSIPQASGFSNAMLAGRTLAEAEPAHVGARQVGELWAYVSARMEKNFRRTVFAVPRVTAGGGFGRRGVQP